MRLKLAVTTFGIYKEKLLSYFSKIIKKKFAAIDRTTRIGFELA